MTNWLDADSHRARSRSPLSPRPTFQALWVGLPFTTTRGATSRSSRHIWDCLLQRAWDWALFHCAAHDARNQLDSPLRYDAPQNYAELRDKRLTGAPTK